MRQVISYIERQASSENRGLVRAEKDGGTGRVRYRNSTPVYTRLHNVGTHTRTLRHKHTHYTINYSTCRVSYRGGGGQLPGVGAAWNAKDFWREAAGDKKCAPNTHHLSAGPSFLEEIS